MYLFRILSIFSFLELYIKWVIVNKEKYIQEKPFSLLSSFVHFLFMFFFS